MLVDDRRPSFEGWLERKLDGLTEGIGREAESWLRTMRDGSPRSRARSLETAWRHMNNVRPALLDWSQRYDHTCGRSPATTSRPSWATCTGHAGPASWSRCGRCSPSARRRGSSSATRPAASRSASTPTASPSPSARTTSTRPPRPPQPRQPGWCSCSPRSTPPAPAPSALPRSRRRPGQPQAHHRRAGPLDRRVHPPDPARLARLPAHPLARHRQPAPAHQPAVSDEHRASQHDLLRQDQTPRQAATPERLRVDRQLEEALACGPDPLHLAAVFGLDPKTAIRYTENARGILLLTTRAEEQDPASSREPKGQNEP